MIDKFMKDGWCIVDIPHSESLQNVTIDDVLFLQHMDDNALKKYHIIFSEEMWAKEVGLILSAALLPVIQQFIGLDVMVQYYPYFRIARPGKRQDNIGYHKDTQYGQTPYELAVHIPFVDLDEKSAIRVISGSHLMPENAFTLVTPEGERVEKGSIENRIGKPHSPKPLAVPEGMKTTPLVTKVGQAAIFSPAIFHGQEVNEGDVTRVSCDLRFVSALHSDKVRIGKVHAGYVLVSQSPIEQIAKRYYEAQK